MYDLVIGFNAKMCEDWALDTNCGMRKGRDFPFVVEKPRHTDAIPYIYLAVALYLLLALKCGPHPCCKRVPSWMGDLSLFSRQGAQLQMKLRTGF